MYDDINLEDDMSILISASDKHRTPKQTQGLVEAHDRILAGFNARCGKTDGSEHDPVAQLESALRENEALRGQIACALASLSAPGDGTVRT